jgi:hypothetical protein
MVIFPCCNCGGEVSVRSCEGMEWKANGGIKVQVPAFIRVPRCKDCGEDFLSPEDVECIEAACQLLIEKNKLEKEVAYLNEIIRISSYPGS